jgi:hypothetical protein
MVTILPQESFGISLVQVRFQDVLCSLRSADLDEAQADILWAQAWHAVDHPHPKAQLRALQELQQILHPLCVAGEAVNICLI